MSVVPEHYFIKTTLLSCTFKSLDEFALVGPNIQTVKSQYDKTLTGVNLELVSYGSLRISSHPLQVKAIDIRVLSQDGKCTLGATRSAHHLFSCNFLKFDFLVVYLDI